ncbi:flagellar basal-body M-ring protein/flagellar hook-basal body protein fliF [Bradyrhizobium barranii subsp. barranii]
MLLSRAQVQQLLNNLLELGPRRLMALGLIGFAVLVTVVGGAYYLSRPEFETLYTGLNREDVTRIGAALREQNITFDVNTAGDAVSVRPSQTMQARMLLAEKGLPTSANSGYELFDKIGSLGLTSFMQEVTKLRALEGEIARTVQLMKGVKAARVHIVMPVRGSFRATQQPPSASVVLRTDGAIEARTAQSIRHLVAAAIPGMSRDKVTVLDADGSMLLAEEDEASAAPTKMASLQKTVGGMVQENIRKALTPYLGLDNFEVSVAPQLSTDKRQTNETVYDPESRAERSVRNVREKESSQNADRSTPTTVQQNLPDQQVNSGGTKNSSEDKTRREDVTNFEVSSKTTTTVSDGYLVKKLFIAVLVNRARLVADLGDKSNQAIVDSKLAEISQLAATAGGLDKQRGDQIQVTAVDFIEGSRELAPVPPISFVEMINKQLGSVINAVTILAVASMLVWFGLRPAVNGILTHRAARRSRPRRPRPPSLKLQQPLHWPTVRTPSSTSSRISKARCSGRRRSGWSRSYGSIRCRRQQSLKTGCGARRQHERGYRKTPDAVRREWAGQVSTAASAPQDPGCADKADGGAARASAAASGPIAAAASIAASGARGGSSAGQSSRRCLSSRPCRRCRGRRCQGCRGARPQRDPARRGAGQMVRPAGGHDRGRLRDGLPRDRNQHRKLGRADIAAFPRRRRP